MIKRLPKWAEVAIEHLCIAAGAVAHSPEDDLNGWDYLVEFPPESHPGPADTHPPAKSACVQVKSKIQGRPACRITLTNALKAAQSMQPWFLVLVIVENDGSKPAICAAHLWEDFMRRALMAVRQAENERNKSCPLYTQ